MSLIVGGLIAVGVIFMFVVLPALVHKAIGPKLEKRIHAVYKPEDVVLQDLKALSFGLESKGVTQSRGNGALVLTGKDLAWFQFTPDFDLRIPLDSITKVDAVKWHLGKSLGKEVLFVAFTNNGKPDSMAWNVMDLAGWRAKLETAATHRDTMVK
jgi:hypothetical protein